MASAAAHVDDDNPWPGLDSYSEAAQKWFHGRDSDSAEMLRLIRQSSFVMLYGKSGLGKSSMLKAGVFPPLREARFLPVYLRLDYTEGAEQPPLQQALARLLQEAALNGIAAPPAEPGEGLWAYLQRRDRPLWTADNFPLTPVLVFDQFEEVFSRGGSAEHIKKVLDALADLVGDRLTSELMANPDAARRLNLQSQRYRVVLSFRSDFLAEVESWQRSASLPKHEALHLKAMSRATAIDAVAKAGAAVLEPGVAEQIVDFVLERDEAGGRASEVEPVLLSLCCYQLNNRRRRPAKIDSVLLGQVGKDILQDFYGEALAGMPARVSVFIEDNLIQGGRYRSTFPRAEAIDSGALQAQELEALTQRRLLRVDPQGDVPRIELIHDRLVAIVRDAKDKRLTVARQQAEREQAEKDAEERRQRELMAQTLRSRNRMRWALAALALLTVGLVFSVSDAQREAVRANAEAERANAETMRANAETDRATALARLAEDKANLAVQAEEAANLSAAELAVKAMEVTREKDRADQQRALAEAAAQSARDSGRRAEALRLAVEAQSMLAGTRDGDDTRAFQQLLASHALLPGPETQAALFEAAVARQHLRALQPWVVEQPAAVVGLAVSPDSRWLAIGHRDGALSLRPLNDPRAPAQRVVGAHATAAPGASAPFVRTLVFSPDGRWLYSAGADGLLRRWRTQPLEAAGEPMRGHVGPVYGLALSADGRQLASGGRDGTVRLWDANSGQPLGQPLQIPQNTGPVWAVAYRPDEPGQLAVATARRAQGGAYVAFVDTQAMAVRSDSYRAHGEDTLHLAFSPKGRFAVSGSSDNTVRVRDLSRPGGEAGASVRIDGHQGDVWSVAVSPDGRWVASAGADSTVRLWRTGNDEAIGLPLGGHTQGVPAVVFSPDGQWLVSGSLDGTVRQWRVRLSAPPGSAELPLASGPGSRVASARQGRLTVSVPADDKSTIKVRDDERGIGQELDVTSAWSAAPAEPAVDCAASEAADASLAGAAQPASKGARVPSAVALSRDGARLALAYPDGSLRRWDMATLRPLGPAWRPSSCGLLAVGWSDDGQRLAAVDRAGHVMLLDAAGALLPLGPAGQPAYRTMPGARALALAGDGRRIALSGVSSERGDRPWLRVLDVGKADALEFAGTLQADSALAFSPDGQWLFSGNRGGKVRLWNARTGQPMSKPLAAHEAEVAAVVPLDDGSGFVSLSPASFGRFWPTQPQSWPKLMCEKLQSNPSRRQWREWVSSQIDYRCVCPGLAIAADAPASLAPQSCPG
jgi:WD40 repeat protein